MGVAGFDGDAGGVLSTRAWSPLQWLSSRSLLSLLRFGDRTPFPVSAPVVSLGFPFPFASLSFFCSASLASAFAFSARAYASLDLLKVSSSSSAPTTVCGECVLPTCTAHAGRFLKSWRFGLMGGMSLLCAVDVAMLRKSSRVPRAHLTRDR